jgi:hypothetical protein
MDGTRYHMLSTGPGLHTQHLLRKAVSAAAIATLHRDEGLALLDLCYALAKDRASQPDVSACLQVCTVIRAYFRYGRSPIHPHL